MAYTYDQKVKLLKKNQIFTIHKDFTHIFPQCHQKANGCIQLLVEKVIKQEKRNKFQIIGTRFDSPVFNSFEELVEIIDWVDYKERSDYRV